MNQLAINFSAPYIRHSATSKAAAKALKPQKATIDRLAVLACIKQAGEYGCTDDEIQRATGLSGDTERPRRVKLAEDGLIRVNGERQTASGRFAQVWVAVQ